MSNLIIDSFIFPATGGFTPPDISGNVLWLDGNDTDTMFDAVVGGSNVTLNSMPVLRWEDKSGNGNNATQATSPPILMTVGGINNINSLDFQIPNYYDLALSIDSPMTVFFVVRFDSFVSSASPRVVDIVGPSEDVQIARVNTLGGVWTTKDSTHQAGIVSTSWSAATSGIDYLIASVFTGAAETFYDANVSQSPTATSVVGVAGSGSKIGRRADGNGSTRLDGKIGEIIIYDTAISEPNRALVQTYLNDKWAVY